MLRFPKIRFLETVSHPDLNTSMMKNFLSSLVLLLFCAILPAQIVNTTIKVADVDQAGLPPAISEVAKIKPPIGSEPSFQSGEELEYSLSLGFITAGKGSIVVREEMFNGQKVFHSILSGATTGMIDGIFKVRDVYESYFRPIDNLPLKAIRNVREGSYKFYDEQLFYPEAGMLESQKKGKLSIPEKTLDMASVLYYLRRINFEIMSEGDIIYFDTFFSKALFPFYVIYRGRETVKTSLGTFSCIRLVPVVEPGRIFKRSDGMNIWLTDDTNKVPVLIQFDVWAGSFKGELVRYKKLKYPLTSLKKR